MYIAAGDIYIEDNVFLIKIYVQTDGISYEPTTKFAVSIDSMILGYAIAENFTQLYALKNYNVK